MPVFWFEFEHVVELGDVSADAIMTDGELDQHLDEVEAHFFALGHQVKEATTSFTLSVDRGVN